MKQVVVDENLLCEIVDRLVKAIDPDRIVLFGSRARGDERAMVTSISWLLRTLMIPHTGESSPPTER